MSYIRTAARIINWASVLAAPILFFEARPAAEPPAQHVVTSSNITVEPPTKVPAPGLILHGQVQDVVDGDTVSVLLRLQVKVRFLGLDAPETNTSEGKKAAADLKLHAESKPCTVYLAMPNADGGLVGNCWSFERWLGSVWIDGDKKSLAQWQIDRGNVKQTQKTPPASQPIDPEPNAE